MPAGSKFSYASVETQVLGLVLRNAVGRPVAEYLSENLAADGSGSRCDVARWTPRPGGDASAASTPCCATTHGSACCWRTTAARATRRSSRRPREAATTSRRTRASPARARRRYLGYGYQTWIFPGERRMFALLGVHGQAIFVDPASRLVLVHTAVRKQPSRGGATELRALWPAVVDTFGR